MEGYEYLVKVVTIGGKGTGKTSICRRISGLEFSENEKPSMGIDYFSKIVQRNKLQLWDFGSTVLGLWAGYDTSSTLLRGTKMALVVYDVTSRESFQRASDMIPMVSRFPMCLVGNKVDLEDRRQVSTAEGETLALSCGASFCETSAKKDGFDQLLLELVRAVSTLH